MPFTIGGEWVSSSKEPLKHNKKKVFLLQQKGRTFTVITSLQPGEGKELLKTLKRECHCGGSCEKDKILLQGDHQNQVKSKLKELELL